MAYVAYVTTLKNLRKHPNADRLQLAECFGNTVCVSMEYVADQVGVYFPTDGQLSVEFAEKNNLLRKKDENGNNILGSKVYVDFTEPNRLFGYSVKTLIERGYFDYSKNEQDQEILVYLKNHNYDVEATREYLKNMWGEDYDENAALYKLEEVLAGKYHGEGTDMTDTILAYMAAMEQDQTLVTYGCVEVTEELANILQGLMDKMTFEGVTNSWLKLCYYFDYMGQ